MAGAAGLQWQEVLGWGLGGAVAEGVLGFRLEAELLRWQREQQEAIAWRWRLEEAAKTKIALDVSHHGCSRPI